MGLFPFGGGHEVLAIQVGDELKLGNHQKSALFFALHREHPEIGIQPFALQGFLGADQIKGGGIKANVLGHLLALQDVHFL